MASKPMSDKQIVGRVDPKTVSVGSRLNRARVLVENLYYRKLLRGLLKSSRLGYGLVVTGAESGANFEHIYNNRPQGSYLIGRLIDRKLLNLHSAEATRIRKNTIRQLVWNEVQNNKHLGHKTKVLDLASGSARYLRELVNEHRQNEVESLCVDKDIHSVRLGQSLCKREGLTTIRFIQANIFRMGRLQQLGSRLNWRANVVIAAGLFMYFNDSEIERILREIHAYLPARGLVVFTSVERLEIKKLMRKTMSVSSGEEWVLYHRKPDWLRTLLHHLGYNDVLILSDPWQLQNVCAARKSPDIPASHARRPLGASDNKGYTSVL